MAYGPCGPVAVLFWQLVSVSAYYGETTPVYEHFLVQTLGVDLVGNTPFEIMYGATWPAMGAAKNHSDMVDDASCWFPAASSNTLYDGVKVGSAWPNMTVANTFAGMNDVSDWSTHNVDTYSSAGVMEAYDMRIVNVDKYFSAGVNDTYDGWLIVNEDKYFFEAVKDVCDRPI
eukprot:3549736-Amphidinium_carterae.1